MFALRYSLPALGRLVVVTVAAAAILVVAFGFGTTRANHSETIYACVSKSGAPRIVNGPDDCKGSESLLQWSSHADGGFADYTVVSQYQDISFDDPGKVNLVAVCPDGYRVMGGGTDVEAGVSFIPQEWYAVINGPQFAGQNGLTADQWRALFVTSDGNVSAGIATLAVHAICATTG